MDSTLYRKRLTELLGELSEEEREDAVAFYLEAIADRIDEGMDESDAVASAPTPEEAAAAILLNAGNRNTAPSADGVASACPEGDNGAPAPADASVDDDDASAQVPAKPESFWRRLRKGRLTPMEWVGVVLASPVALCVAAVALGLAIIAAALVLMVAILGAALVLVAWILVLACWIVGISLTVASPACLLFVIWGLQVGDIPYTLVQLGYSCFAFGAGIWVLKGCKALTSWAWRVQRKGFAKLGNALRGAWRKRREGGSADAACADSSGGSTAADAAPTVSTSHRAAEPSAFLRVCLGLVLAGLALVFVGYAASGFNWRVFTSSFYDHGVLTLGGTVVDDPSRLLFGPLFYH